MKNLENLTEINPILLKILEQRKGHYIHALEVNDVYELETVICSLYDEFTREYDINTFIDFFASMQIYCLTEENENDVYNFDIENYINNL